MAKKKKENNINGGENESGKAYRRRNVISEKQSGENSSKWRK
jgi:hypothetical protein